MNDSFGSGFLKKLKSGLKQDLRTFFKKSFKITNDENFRLLTTEYPSRA